MSTSCNLIAKGPHYREQNKIAWGKDKKMIMTAIENYAKKWAKRDNFDVSVLDDWINEIRYIVTTRIRKLQKITKQPPNPVLTDPEVTKCLQNMHNNYVLLLQIKPPTILSSYVKSIIVKFYVMN